MLFTIPTLNDHEIEVIGRINEIRQSLQYVTATPTQWYGFLRRSTFARAIRGSNTIEGYTITEDDALAVVDGEQPFTETKDETWRAVSGYRDAMTYVLQLSNDPHFSFNEGFIRSLHYMMLHYDMTKNPGRWRPGLVYVRDEQKKEIVYEGPDAHLVPKLMNELIESLNVNKNNSDLSVLIRAAMGHLNLVMIHPFSDGNGRMGRCLQTLILAREGILEHQFCSIEEYLGFNTQDYYKVLSNVGGGSYGPTNDAREWIHFCLTAHYRQASNLLRRTREIARVWDQLEIEIRNRGLHERVINALVDAAFGYKIRNSTYRSMAEISENLASRDLKDLVDKGLLIPSGERRGRMYVASPLIRTFREKAREPKIHEDPFISTNPRLPGL
jgi:Fic family protein